jgi:hypothetical protein
MSQNAKPQGRFHNPKVALRAVSYYIFYYSTPLAVLWVGSKLLSRLEAAIGIEPMNKGFADSAKRFAQVPICSLPLGFIHVSPRFNSRVIAQI